MVRGAPERGRTVTARKLISPVVAPSLMTTAELMRSVASEIDALPGGCIPAVARQRAAFRGQVRDLLDQLQDETERLSKILDAALD